MKIGRFITDPIGRSFSDDVYCKLVNLRCQYRGRDMRFSHDQVHDLYHINHNDGHLKIARRNRYKRYDRGIMKWLDYLANTYKLNAVPLRPGDNFVDCGANIGELGVWAAQFGVNYHAFEPEEKEAHCCDLNNFDGNKQTHRAALWYEDTELEFYSKPESADSSIIEIDGFSEVKTVEATTLCKYINSLEMPHVRLLKVEAEGAEPEVLAGAMGCFDKIDYISIDCGNERGIEAMPTFLESDQILLDNGFDVIDSYISRPVFLYKRRGLKN